MIERKQCINVWSDMDTWTNFCIIVSESDIQNAETIIKKAYDEWWELPDTQFEPFQDWVRRNLKQNEIEFEIFFKEEPDRN